jgi:fatty acid desaturase
MSLVADAADAHENAARLHEKRAEVVAHQFVADLHAPRPSVYWTDLLISTVVGWTAFGVAVAAPAWSWTTAAAVAISTLALYRGLCFTHEITHLRRRAVPGFETAWNLLLGVPLLLPTFTYVGVHQSHHNLATYGTKDDPEYLPFRRSRRLIVMFSIQSSLLLPILLLLRFLVLAPVGLVWPRFHRWLETHASSFAMNPMYRRVVTPAIARMMRVWEGVTLAAWAVVTAVVAGGLVPVRMLLVWFVVMALVSLVNTMRVLGAHDYETDGAPRDREGQLADSIDTPGGPWTELWAPVGLRYHALHHYFPGIPYHNLGAAYRRLLAALSEEALDRYRESTSPSLRHSLSTLYLKAGSGSSDLVP